LDFCGTNFESSYSNKRERIGFRVSAIRLSLVSKLTVTFIQLLVSLVGNFASENVLDTIKQVHSDKYINLVHLFPLLI
jgi:hypothetical protein